jgi:hypothetical protein
MLSPYATTVDAHRTGAVSSGVERYVVIMRGSLEPTGRDLRPRGLGRPPLASIPVGRFAQIAVSRSQQGERVESIPDGASDFTGRAAGFDAKRKPRTADTVGASPKRCTMTKEKVDSRPKTTGKRICRREGLKLGAASMVISLRPLSGRAAT